MRPAGPGPGIAHRLRVVHPAPPGDAGVRLAAYGVRELIAPTVIDRPRGTADWLLIAFHQPAELWNEAGRAVPIPAGSLVVWRPHAPHRYGRHDATWLHSWLHADGDLLRGWLDQGALPCERPIPGVPARLLDRCLLRLHEEVAGHARPDPRILRAVLQTWMWEVERAVAGGIAAPAGLVRARTAIESRFRDPLDLAALAALAGCSRQHLCAGFRRWFGVSPIDHLIRTRLHQADLLLQDPATGAAAAAAAVGFGDYRHFARLYRRRFGHPARRRFLPGDGLGASGPGRLQPPCSRPCGIRPSPEDPHLI